MNKPRKTAPWGCDCDDCGHVLSQAEAAREQQFLAENRRESLKSTLRLVAIIAGLIAVVVMWFLIPWPKIP